MVVVAVAVAGEVAVAEVEVVADVEAGLAVTAILFAIAAGKCLNGLLSSLYS